MHLRRFKGRELPEVVRQVREELGPEAVILHTRDSRPRGLLRFVRGGAVEVVAAVDDAPRLSAVAPGLAPPAPGLRLVGAAPPPPVTEPAPAPAPAGPAVPPAPPLDPLRAEVASLRHLLVRFSGARALPATMAPFYTWLLERGVDEVLAFRILESTATADAAGRPLKPEALGRLVEDRVLDMLRTGERSLTPPATVAFVGPTGSGKTTTLSKLAVRSHLAGITTHVLSLDGVNLGAAGQLDALSSVLGVPCTLAVSREELGQALERGLSPGLTLIDTPGLSPRDPAGLAAVAELLGQARPTEVHLVLSATTKIDDALAAVRSFQSLGITHLLFTRLDEATTYGSLLSVAIEGQLPVSYLATGREVPNDIRPTTARDFVRRVLRGDQQP